MIKRIIGAAFLLLGLATGSAAGAQDTTEIVAQTSREAAPEVLRKWVDARAGTGEPVHWISEGAVYAYPSGEKLVGMIGFDSSRVIWPTEPGGPVIHLTRKTYVYTDPDTGEIISEFGGKPAEPIAYPYQMITYRYENGRIYGDVEQGTGDAVRQIKSTTGMMARMMGDTLAVTAPVFLDFPLPGGGQYEAWENYDFFIQPEGSVEEPHQMSWQRYGAPPPFIPAEAVESGKAIYHLLTHRVESHAEFPPALLEWAKANKPQWLAPPRDMAEIRALQTGRKGPAGRSDLKSSDWIWL